MNSIGTRIRNLRKAMGMTQNELASKVGVSTSSIGMYERGERSVDIEMLVKIGRVFSVSTDSLLGLEEISAEPTDILSEMHDKILNSTVITYKGIMLSVENREKLLSTLEFVADMLILEKKKRDGGADKE